MSGEAVLIPLAWGAVAGAVTGVAEAVHAALEAQRQAALLRAQQERERVAAWREFQQQQGEEQARAQRARAVLRQVQQNLTDTPLTEAATRTTGVATAEGFVEEPGRPQRQWINHIATQFSQLPAEIIADSRLPFARLREQLTRLERSAAVSSNELADLSATLERTLADHHDRLVGEMEQQAKLTQAASDLLTSLLQLQELAPQPSDRDRLQTLQQQLLTLLERWSVTPGNLDIIATQFAMLQERIQREITAAGMRDFVSQRIDHHLQAMGYAALSPFSEKHAGQRREAEFGLPDGDRLRVALQPDGRVGFQLTHETATMIEKTLTGEAVNFFRQQEARWCKDMKELIRRLVKDGVSYQIQFEREVPEQSIPVVVVEAVDELLDDDQDEERRHESDQVKKQERHFT